MSDTHASTTQVAPVVREVTAHAPIATCFRVFVHEFASWWPEEHHIGEDRTITDIVLEAEPGGRVYDVDTAGVECQWGTVTAVDPPNQILIAWHIQGDWTIDLDPALASEIAVSFTAQGEAETLIHLEHRNLERHGASAEGLRSGISGDGGWTTLLARAAAVMEGREPRPLPA